MWFFFGFFLVFFPTQETLTDTSLNSIKVFGAGQLDVAAKAVSASFDTL